MRKPSLNVVCVVALCSLSAFAVEPGETVKPVELRNYDDSAAPIPDFGKKIIALFYGDADVSDMNDPMADALKAKEFDKTVYRGLGVANMQDSKAPNFLIRSIVKGKVEKYKATILLDQNLSLATAWGFGDCNNTSVFIVIGADEKVKYIHKGPIRGAEVEAATKLVEGLVNELKGTTGAAAKPSEPAIAPAAAGAAPVAPTP